MSMSESEIADYTESDVGVSGAGARDAVSNERVDVAQAVDSGSNGFGANVASGVTPGAEASTAVASVPTGIGATQGSGNEPVPDVSKTNGLPRFPMFR